MSATATAAMFYALGLAFIGVIVLVTHLSTQATLKALASAMQALTEAIRDMKGK